MNTKSILVIACTAIAACSDDGTRTTAAWENDASESSSDAADASSTDTDPSASTDPSTTASTLPPDDDTGPSTQTATTDASESSTDDGPSCEPTPIACTGDAECCSPYTCGSTSLGQVCCGGEGAPCATANGEHCCGTLLCIDGTCGFEGAGGECAPACTEAPALVIEKQRLANIGGSFLGICGDANHTYGYHVPAANLPADDYSMQGAANVPVCEWHAAAIDIGMDWNVSRDWLAWLIEGIRNDDLQGIAEVIGSYDGVNVRYWSDNSGWHQEGEPYDGDGHDSWTHVSIYRSTALDDHGILSGWTADAGPP